jgi:hypothetical protein
MKKILDWLRKNREIYEPLRKIYGYTFGLWWLKTAFVKYVGFYNGKRRIKLLSNYEGDRIISEKIKSGESFMLARYGTGEFRSLFGEDDINLLYFYSGFFPKDRKLLPKFRKIYLESSKLIDMLAISLYKNQFRRKIKFIRKFPNINYIIQTFDIGDIRDLWIKNLEGKKVLVIHPFKSTIKEQMKKREKLGILPKLKSLEIIRAVQTLADNKDPRFETWFDALDYMKKEIDKKDFDIAIIGCGAYGLPLAAYIKSIGKQALHIAGKTQLFFGIKGKRWDNDPYVNYTKDWIYPLEKDKMKDYKKIEGGAYW